MEHILEELQSNETWTYMTYLESEKVKMQNQIQDLSSQLQSLKVFDYIMLLQIGIHII